MIENARQYEVAKQQAARLEAGLARLLGPSKDHDRSDPVLLDTAHAGVKHVLAQLRAEISEFESRTGHAKGAQTPRMIDSVRALVAIAYPEAGRAEQVMAELEELQSEFLIDLESAVYVTKDADGKVKVHGVERLTRPGSAWGAFWGLLFAPMPAMLALAGSGAIFGHFTKVGLDSEFVKDLSDKLGPNSSAVFILVRERTLGNVVAELSKFGGTILTSNLPEHADKKLQEALNAANAERA